MTQHLKKDLDQGLRNVSNILGKKIDPVFIETFTGAFYAGAYSTFQHILNNAAALPDDKAEEYLSELQKEIDDYVDAALKRPPSSPRNPTSSGSN